MLAKRWRICLMCNRNLPTTFHGIDLMGLFGQVYLRPIHVSLAVVPGIGLMEGTGLHYLECNLNLPTAARGINLTGGAGCGCWNLSRSLLISAHGIVWVIFLNIVPIGSVCLRCNLNLPIAALGIHLNLIGLLTCLPFSLNLQTTVHGRSYLSFTGMIGLCYLLFNHSLQTTAHGLTLADVIGPTYCLINHSLLVFANGISLTGAIGCYCLKGDHSLLHTVCGKN